MNNRLCKGCEKPLLKKASETDKEFSRRSYHNESCRNLEFRRKKREEERRKFGDLSAPKPMTDIGMRCSGVEYPYLDDAIKALPEGWEPATPFQGLVDDHLSCLHPDGGHEPREVEVTAVLDRTAVVLGPRGYRWLERHADVRVVPADFKVRVKGANAIQADDARTRGRERARIRRIASEQQTG